MPIGVRVEAAPKVAFAEGELVERDGNGGEVGRAGAPEDGGGVGAVERANHPGGRAVSRRRVRAVQVGRGGEQGGRERGLAIGGGAIRWAQRTLEHAKAELRVDVGE